MLKTVDPLPAAIREVGEKPAVIGQAIDLPVHPEQSSTAAAQSPESDSLIPRNLSDHLWELEMSKEFRDFAVLDNLESSPIAAVAIAETEKINYRSIKKPAPSYWYFQASWQTIPRGRNGDFKFYQVQPNKAEPVYVPLEGGQEWLELYPQYTEGVFDKGKRWDQNYGFTLGRQFRSGFDISIGAMFYSEPDTRQEVLARVPDNPGQAFVLRTQYWEATYARLDVRYMFRRRHPFKFYFGVTIVGLIQDENIVEDRFYFPERGIDQLITSQVYRGSDLFYLAVPAARAGVLWRLTPNWQVGLDVIMTLPGVQVQYNFP
ncbi:hypothetical protein CRP01_39240 [Flavilitoribacter nigricans DSM 23189 = NBRC 102662]|uniref:Uncharacterized protein n=1 Tax=Flavilitoribacter nigricans (strain ATCC 23147 / DSM 23189 / NBRC 102662 / NCIMB 1420 / SS-2) TaxID=1122177 RepID=A0A2D0MYS3_FLAN2|nr:hypothetical protein CRP01_39240 [Flavilitoribacter nigricans DSM 23189 = NBRC 102662]